jgi:hypothetical protein
VGVQVAERLVHQDHHGLGGDGASERDPLLLAPRKLVRIPVVEVLEVQDPEDLAGPAAPFRTGTLMQAEDDVLAHREVGKEGVVLEDHAHAPFLRRNPASLSGATSLPWIRMLPESGASKPAISRSVVVLPQPLGPSRVRISPSRTSSDTPSTASTGPGQKRLRTPSS